MIVSWSCIATGSRSTTCSHKNQLLSVKIDEASCTKKMGTVCQYHVFCEC